LSTYTQWYWKIDLHNLLHFLTLRVDSHAQWEIQQYAQVMAGMFRRVAPLSYEAWIDYDVCGASFSRMELEAVRGLMNGERPETELAGREWEEFLEKLRRKSTPSFDLDLTRAVQGEHFAERFASAVPGVQT
jgi:thymidylate synthase (FAD)